ncbi:MAG TPA: MFS transporter [Holophagaceae bacterium]|nr:MFS transporter [Holophagaceae bacterium]
MTEQKLWSRDFTLVWAMTFLTFFAAFQLFPTVPFRLGELGLDLGARGRFMSLFTGGSAVGALLTGPLGDRLGARRMAMICTLGFGAFLLAYPWLHTASAFLWIAFPHGVVWSGVLTATMSLLGRVLREEGRAQGLSLYGLASPGGVVVGPVVGLWSYHTLGFLPMCTSLAVIFGVLSWLARKLPQDPPAHETPTPFQLPSGAVVVPCLILFLTALGYGTFSTFTPQEASAAGLTGPWAGTFLTAMAVGMVLMRFAMAHTGFGARPIRLLPWMLAGAAAGMLLLGLLPGTLLRHALSAILYGAGYSMVHTLVNARLLEVVPAERRGGAFGALLFSFDSGIGLGSFALGAFIGRYGFRPGWLLGALLVAMSLPLAVRLVRPNQA